MTFCPVVSRSIVFWWVVHLCGPPWWPVSLCVIFLLFKQYDLRILSERITCTTIITRDKRHKDFPQGNHKGENSTTSSEIEWASMVAIKIQRHKDYLQQLISLTCASTSSLTHVPQLSECVCRNEESLTSIYILPFTLFPLQQVGLT